MRKFGHEVTIGSKLLGGHVVTAVEAVVFANGRTATRLYCAATMHIVTVPFGTKVGA